MKSLIGSLPINNHTRIYTTLTTPPQKVFYLFVVLKDCSCFDTAVDTFTPLSSTTMATIVIAFLLLRLLRVALVEGTPLSDKVNHARSDFLIVNVYCLVFL